MVGLRNVVRENTYDGSRDRGGRGLRLFITLKGIVNRKIAICQDGPVGTVQPHTIFSSNTPCLALFGSGKDSRRSQIIIGAVQLTGDSFSIFSNRSDTSVAVEVSFELE